MISRRSPPEGKPCGIISVNNSDGAENISQTTHNQKGVKRAPNPESKDGKLTVKSNRNLSKLLRTDQTDYFKGSKTPNLPGERETIVDDLDRVEDTRPLKRLA